MAVDSVPMADALLSLAAVEAPRATFNPQRRTSGQGQRYIDDGRYAQAIHEFTFIIDGHPTEVGGYRGRIEAELPLDEFSNAVRDYARVTAFVLPVHADTQEIILDGYAARLSVAPDHIAALTGGGFPITKRRSICLNTS